MRNRNTAAVMLSSLILLTVAVAPGEDADKPMVRLGEPPKIELAARPAVTDAQTKHVKDLIASLANLDDSHFGLASINSGSAFAAVLSRRETEKFFMDDRIITTWPAFKELVALGPDAMPCLLDSLDDVTPTKVVYRHGPDEHGMEFGMMGYGTEFSVNPLDPAEAWSSDLWLEGDKEDRIHTYTVKVGDICFLAIGQITGRSYHPARYQSTGCIVINSPTHNPKICSFIRKAWTSTDPRHRLFESLRLDYATEAADTASPRGETYVSNEFQCSAATRLLYYFQKESASLIAARLGALNVTPGPNDKPGSIQPVEFIKAVAWSHDDAVRASVARIFSRTDEPDIVLASSPSVDDKAILIPRLAWVAGTVPDDLSRINADNRARWIVNTLIDRVPDNAKEPLGVFLKNRDPFRIWLVTEALSGSKVDWDIDLLSPLLADKRDANSFYRINGKTGPELTTRVCDAVASTLAANHSDLQFQLLGTHEDLDRQIATMQNAIAAKRRDREKAPDGREYNIWFTLAEGHKI